MTNNVFLCAVTSFIHVIRLLRIVAFVVNRFCTITAIMIPIVLSQAMIVV